MGEEAGPARRAGPGLTAERMTAQLLSGPPAKSVADVVRRLLAVQAQDPRGARLSVRARSAGLVAEDVDNALTADRSVVVGWLNRGTLHLVTAEDFWWLHALTTPSMFTGNARRLAEEGVSPAQAERGVAAIVRALSGGPLSRAHLRERVASAGVRTEGQALVHILWLASLRGLIVRGPVVGVEQAYVLARDWIPAPGAQAGRDADLAELARRYLAGHGPASERDLAKWSGLGLRDARRALAAIAGQLADRDDGLASLAGVAPEPELPAPRLLGAFDEVLLGWVSRRDVLGGHEPEIVAGGLFRPFALVAGRAAATWSITGGRVSVRPFAPLAPAESVSLEAEAADVERFLAGPWLQRGR